MPILFIFIYILLALLIAAAGKHKRFGFWGYFFATLLFTPLVGLLLLIAGGTPRHS